MIPGLFHVENVDKPVEKTSKCPLWRYKRLILVIIILYIVSESMFHDVDNISDSPVKSSGILQKVPENCG